jgi:asparaginyl-tRNA synthetase
MQDQGFCYTHTPILTSSDAEGAGETFQIHKGSASSVSHAIADSGGRTGLDGRVGATEEEDHFFSKPAFLTVSSQLHLEALASSISRVYTLSPCFRAERSQTNRHLAEFWMLEAEWAFTSHLEDIMSVVEDSLRPLARMTLSEYPSFWNQSNDAKRQVLADAGNAKSPWTRMTYTEAVCELSKHQSISKEFEFDPAWGRSLQSEHERWLSEKLIGGPVFVTDYPTSLKPFYMRVNNDEKTVACFDLLVPYLGELVGGSLREERLDLLQHALDVHKMDSIDYAWYLDLRKYGSAPHGGYGMGFERLISWLSGIDNVRECIPMPRWAGRMLL